MLIWKHMSLKKKVVKFNDEYEIQYTYNKEDYDRSRGYFDTYLIFRNANRFLVLEDIDLLIEIFEDLNIYKINEMEIAFESVGNTRLHNILKLKMRKWETLINTYGKTN